METGQAVSPALSSLAPFTWPTLSRYRREKMLAAAAGLIEAQTRMIQARGNLLHYLGEGADQHTRWQHYPTGDRIDHATGAQYFYHCHRENMQSGEHGHFHTFIRTKTIPKSTKPLPLEDWDLFIKNPMTHLAAIALDVYGNPTRLFATNRWVTSEIWYDAAALDKIRKKFHFTLDDDPYWTQLDSWVENMLVLYAPQLAWLHQARDICMDAWVQSTNSENHYTDKRLEEIVSIPIDLPSQIAWLQEGL